MDFKRASLFSLFILCILFTTHDLKAQKRFSVMTYNVENFFDIIHDVYKLPSGQIVHKQDYTYLPKAVKDGAYKKIIEHECAQLGNFYYKRECFNKDWNAEVYKVKLVNTLKALTYLPNKCGSDIIFLQEVENIRVISDIATHLPKHCGYKYYGLIEGPDKRGIDIGFISRFPKTKHRLIDYPLYAGDKKRRSLYQANFNVYGRDISVIGNHWPSMGTKDVLVRKRAAYLLGKAFRESTADATIAVGDFNTSVHKEPEVYTYLKRYVRDALMMNIKPNMPGSHFYRGHWDFLDRIFVTKKSYEGPTASIRPLWESFRVIHRGLLWDRDIYGKNGKLKYKKGTPRRFSDYFKSGYSDHLPLTMTFELL